ncbi:MAG: DNA-binding protein WhiA [Eubacteriaceae bacterium]|nr:DNA-binding protein WhiA [Eubacteriaceae bacterium]
MSFNEELKSAMARQVPEEMTECTAALYAMVFSSFSLSIRGFGQFGLKFESTQSVSATYAFRLIKTVFGCSPELVKIRQKDNFGEKNRYILSIDDSAQTMEMLHTFNMLDSEGTYVSSGIDRSLMTSPDDTREFLKAMVIACGYIYEPSKSFRLEFRFSNSANAASFMEMLESTLGINAHLWEARRSATVYIKRLDDIVSYLAACGAGKFALDLQDVSVLKEIREGAQRAANCDIANTNKMMEASRIQIAAIDAITNAGRLAHLSEPLLMAARLRSDNPEATLSELSKIAGISRSTLDKRLRKIIKIAEDL